MPIFRNFRPKMKKTISSTGELRKQRENDYYYHSITHKDTVISKTEKKDIYRCRNTNLLQS